MDKNQFDGLTKLLGSKLGRRGALGAALITVATAFGLAETEAKKHGKKKGRGKNKHRGKARSQGETCTPTVTVTGRSTNPTCADIGSTGFKVDPPVSGSKTVHVGDCDCKVDYTVSSDGKKLSFTSTCAIRYVIVKGGNQGANVYDFGSCCGGGSKGEVDLTTPTGQQISHFSFCGIQCCVPKTCEQLGKECGEWDDQCCGTVDCGDCDCGNCSDEGICECVDDGEACDADCDCCGEHSECKHDVCECVPENNPCGNQCDTRVTDRCGNEVECPACECPHSCTLGYYKQNTCRWPGGISPDDPFPCDPSITYLDALNGVGGGGAGTLAAQQAAAFLNQALDGCYPIEDICNATTAELDAANSETDSRTCPLAGCGRS